MYSEILVVVLLMNGAFFTVSIVRTGVVYTRACELQSHDVARGEMYILVEC
jgi:hypothetical protein